MPLFIYLDNIEKNVKIIKEKTNKEIMAVIKSDAYGLGAKQIIKTLKKSNINFFVFDKYQEYLKNQNYLKNAKVLILESVVKYQENQQIRYSINSLIDVYKIKNISFNIKVHLRIDTGMNRLGLRNKDELEIALKILRRNPNIDIEGIYTHFSSDALETKYYQKQKEKFKKIINDYQFKIVHANATRNINKEILGNYVRIGIGLYGYHQPFFKLHRSVSLNAKVVNVFNPTSQDKISYLQKKVKNSKIGVINYGYNDVDLSDIKNIYLNGQKLKLLGKSCMNHTHFIANDKINYLSWLSIFPTNGIIVSSKDYNYQIDWYRILTSLKKMPKNYLRRSNYDIPKIFKYHGEKSNKFRT